MAEARPGFRVLNDCFLGSIQLWIGTYLHCLESWVLVWESGNEAMEKEETVSTLLTLWGLIRMKHRLQLALTQLLHPH